MPSLIRIIYMMDLPADKHDDVVEPAHLRDPQEQDRIKILIFTRGTRRFAVPLNYVRGMGKVKGVTRVPGVPPFVEGVVYTSGEIYALLALDYFWDWKPHSKNFEEREFLMVILEKEGISFGIEIERNIQIKEIPLQSIKREKNPKDEHAIPYIMGIISDGKEEIHLIDLTELMVNSELYAFISNEEQ
jgi:purine-binding chemotaxis protein CheW